MGATEVTNAQYEQFDPGHQKQRVKNSAEDDAAVVNVSYDDAVAFCQWLSARESKPYNTGNTLPDGYQQMVPGALEGFPQFFPTQKTVAAGLTAGIDQLGRSDKDAANVPPHYELVKKASLLMPAGASAFTPPVLFWQCADANNHAPALFIDKKGTIFHFNGSRALPGSIFRTSADNGVTWSKPMLLNGDLQPNEATIQTADGRILATCDSVYDHAGTVTMSHDGQTWTFLSDESRKCVYQPGGSGPCIAGIHVGLSERKDGSLCAFGRVDNQTVAATFDHELPTSVSTDGGKTWTYGVSELPGIISGQRMILKRIREGPLLLCTSTDDLAHRDDGQVTRSKTEAEMVGMPFRQPDGSTKAGYGMIAARRA